MRGSACDERIFLKKIIRCIERERAHTVQIYTTQKKHITLGFCFLCKKYDGFNEKAIKHFLHTTSLLPVKKKTLMRIYLHGESRKRFSCFIHIGKISISEFRLNVFFLFFFVF